ncbi:MAG: hypothetical protein COS84_06435 [Armatimonadetes bacterium CG07_land_8_20_14_0_80_40_9]|nr:MAG: hypothetical protein COS84_06435 [Armatimonadetes bacterium CG07_land_8_20_14_0_80_40_9]
MNEAKLCFNLGILKHFINNALGLSYETYKITGFELVVPLMEASSHNTYVETVSNKADVLYLRCKESLKSMMAYSYLNYIKRVSAKFKLHKKPVILAFDYTDEDFYGDVQGPDIIGWTKKDAVTGKFKFITCSIISDEIPQKIPLITLPIRIGHYKSSVVKECLFSIQNYIGKIELILFDRGFYDKDLMYELTKLGYSYLIFVPKHQDKQSILYPMEVGEEVAIYNEYEVNKNKSKYAGENILVFLKQIYDSRSEKNYDWVFATNVEKVLLENLITTYKKRWRMETQFRVQDDAKIKCKSKDMKIRYFLFLFEQMLQVIWMCFYKEETSFKEFIIAMAKMSRKWTKIEER